MATREWNANSEATSTETRRRDRFSNLPPELLSSVFDLAYRQESPAGPLSKNLLPFYLQGVYQHCRLPMKSCSPDFDCQHADFRGTPSCKLGLSESVRALLEAGPEIGRLVRTLSIREYVDPWNYAEGFTRKLISLTSRLTSIVLDNRAASFTFHEFLNDSTPADLDKVRHLERLEYHPPLTTEMDEMRMEPYGVSLAPLARLPALRCLTLLSWASKNPFRPRPSFVLASLVSLTVCGQEASQPTVMHDIIVHGPKLQHLGIRDESVPITIDNKVPDNTFRQFAPLACLLPPTLRSLDLHLPLPAPNWSDPELAVLPSFPELESLNLNQYSSDISDYLRRLPRLHKVSLPVPGGGRSESLRPLFDKTLPPHPSLDTIHFEFDYRGRIGRPFSPPGEDELGLPALISTMQEDGWVFEDPRIRDFEPELCALLKLASNSTIRIEGGAVSAIRVERAHRDERSRRDEYARAQSSARRAARRRKEK